MVQTQLDISMTKERIIDFSRTTPPLIPVLGEHVELVHYYKYFGSHLHDYRDKHRDKDSYSQDAS